MTPEEIRGTIQDAIGQGWSFAWWHYLLWLVVTGAGAYLGTYLREKGRNTATKEDVGAITKKVEEVKSELALLSKKRSYSLMKEYASSKGFKAGSRSLKNTALPLEGRWDMEVSFIRT